MRAAIEEFKATGARLRLPYYLLLQARVCRRAGRYEHGLVVIDEALGEARETNERVWDAELHRTRGELLLANGTHVEDAEIEFERALRIARDYEARALELRAAVSLARLRSRHMRALDARQPLAELYAWFTEGHETPDLRRARLLLARLA
jgi:predicted ATPase